MPPESRCIARAIARTIVTPIAITASVVYSFPTAIANVAFTMVRAILTIRASAFYPVRWVTIGASLTTTATIAPFTGFADILCNIPTACTVETLATVFTDIACFADVICSTVAFWAWGG